MIYYFVDFDGDITTEENEPGWFKNNPNAYTRKFDAIREAKKRIKERIKELEDYYAEISAKGWKP